MKYLPLTIMLSCMAINASAQFFSGPNSNPQTLTGPANVLKTEIPVAKPSVIGSTYLDEDWKDAKIVLKSGDVIEGLPVRIEIEQGNIEIQYQGETKYLNLKKVDFVSFPDAAGIKGVVKKADQFTSDDVPLDGIVLALNHTERYGMIKQFYIELLQANYNVAMDVGAKDHRKVKREKLYISYNSKLIPAKGPEKKIAAQFGADKEKVLEVINEHKLKLSRETDLITFVKLMQSGNGT